MQEAFGCRPADGDAPGGTPDGPPHGGPGGGSCGASGGESRGARVGGSRAASGGGTRGTAPGGTCAVGVDAGGGERDATDGDGAAREADGAGGDPGPGPPAAGAVAVLDALLADLGAVVHRPAPLERGFALEAGDWPLHVGARAVAGLLELQAEVAPPGAIDPAWLLHRNRRDVRVVRYGSSAAGATWVHGDLALEAVTPATLDDLLARLLGAAEAAAGVAVWPDRG